MNDYRAVFISDLHLGYGRSRTRALSAFLDNCRSDHLYLVGDILDIWRMERRSRWSAAATRVMEQLWRKAQAGVRVHYVLGNHDEALRPLVGDGLSFGNVRLCDRAEHTGLDGRRYLVIHGDQVDQRGRGLSTPLMMLCHKGYSALLHLNAASERALPRLGLRPLNCVDFFRRRSRMARTMIRNYEDSVAAYARDRGYDGVVCGHIHYPQKRTIDGTDYLNCGDWLESQSAVVEHHDGRWELVRYS